MDSWDALLALDLDLSRTPESSNIESGQRLTPLETEQLDPAGGEPPRQAAPSPSGQDADASTEAGWRMLLRPYRNVGGLELFERVPAIEMDAARSNREAHEFVDKLPDAPPEREWFDHLYGPEIDRRSFGPQPEPRLLAGTKKQRPDATLQVHRSHLPFGQSSVTRGKVHEYIDAPKGGNVHYTFNERGEFPGFHQLSGNHRLAAHIARGEDYIPVDVYHSELPTMKARQRFKQLFPGGRVPPKEGAQDVACDEALAFDRGSVRSYDEDGHLHVELANISKATINPYLGKEIPLYKEMGLDPARVYRLLRHPDELRRSADTFRGKPLLIIHKPLNADDHPHEKVVGSVGTDVQFNDPYLQAPLTVWPGDAIGLIRSDRQKELSCGYRYDADMKPGRWRGEDYDGVMRNIRGNHVALVTEGRAGPDVVVGDSKEGLINMKTKPLSQMAVLAQGTALAFLTPMMAQDKTIRDLDLSKVLAKVTAKNYEKALPLLPDAIFEAARPALAADATPEGLSVLLEALSQVKPTEATTPVPGERMDDEGQRSLGANQEGRDDFEDKSEGGEVEGGEGGEAEGGGGGATMEDVKEYLQSCLKPDQYAQLEAILQAVAEGGGGEEEEPPAEGEEGGEEFALGGGEEEGRDSPPNFPGRPKIPGVEGRDGMRTRGAMDEASVRKVVETAVDAERRAQRALADAERFVRPYVGDLIGLDSAESVYRKALSVRGVDTKGISELPALRALVSMQKKAGEARPIIASDAKTAKGYAERFPEASRIGHL